MKRLVPPFFSLIMGFFLMMLWAASPVVVIAEESGEPVLVWDTKALFGTPKVHETKERPAKGMRSFFYEGANYKGKLTKVFAYYATPEGKVPEGGWSAVVAQ